MNKQTEKKNPGEKLQQKKLKSFENEK